MKNYTEIDQERHPSLKKDNKYLILTVFLIIFHFISNLVWIYLNNVPPNWDPAIHIMNTYRYADYVINSFSHFNFIEFMKISNYYPIFVYVFSLPLAFISNNNYKIVLLSGSLFFSIAILFLYLYASSIFSNKKIGFFSALIFSFFITIYQSSRDHMLDLPLTSLILICLFLIHRLKKENKVRDLYLFFLFFAFVQLTKWYAFVYLLIPLLFLLLDKLRKKRLLDWVPLIKGLFLFVVIVLPWYIVNFNTLFIKSSRAWFGETITKISLFSLEFLLSHLKLIILFQTNFFGFLLFVISIYLVIRNISSNKKELLLAIIFNYVFFTFIPNRNVRYLIPLMLYFALIMGYGLVWLSESKKAITLFIFSFLLFYYFISFLILSFGFPIYPNYKYSVRFPIIEWIDIFYLADYPVKVVYDKNIWPHKNIILDIQSLAKKKTSLFLCADRYFLNADNFNLTMMNNSVKNIELSSYYQMQNMEEFLRDFEFVLIPKYHVIGEEKNYVSYKPLTTFQTYFLEGNAQNYDLIKEYHIPASQSLIDDSDVLYLYRRIY